MFLSDRSVILLLVLLVVRFDPRRIAATLEGI
jgi:hypothetical protein